MSMIKTGELLKKTREEKGITLNEVALITKINARTLESMERGEIEGLPQKAFIRGFVQTYAKYLGLDPNEILAMFQEEVGLTKTSTPAGGGSSRPMASDSARRLGGIPDQDPASLSRRWIIGAVGLLLFGAIFFVAELIQKYEKESELADSALTTIGATSSTGTPSSTNDGLLVTGDTLSGGMELTGAVAVAGTTLSTSTTLETQPAPKVTTTTSTTTTRLTTTTTSRSTTSTRMTTSSTTSTTRVTTTTQRSTTTTSTSRTTSTTLSKKPMNLEVLIEALDKVTLEFKIDQNPAKKISMDPEQLQTLKASDFVILDISDGGAVNIIVNGQDRGVPGTLGKPAKIKIP